jgi:hypothetical protein
MTLVTNNELYLYEFVRFQELIKGNAVLPSINAIAMTNAESCTEHVLMNSIKKILFNELRLPRGLEISYPTFRCRGTFTAETRRILGTPGLALRGAGLTFNIYTSPLQHSFTYCLCGRDSVKESNYHPTIGTSSPTLRPARTRASVAGTLIFFSNNAVP